MAEKIALIITGLLFLASIVIFPGLSFCEWMEKKFKEAEDEEPIESRKEWQ